MANGIIIDIPGIKRELVQYFKRELNNLFRTYTDIIRDEIPDTPGPWGRTAWREQLRQRIKLLPVELAGDVLKTKLNYPYNEPHSRSKYYIKYRIIQFGHDEEIRSKPGSMVWGKDIDQGKHPSEAEEEYEIPQLTQEGSDFLGAAFKRIEDRFERDIQAILDNMPPGIVLNHIELSKGSW